MGLLHVWWAAGVLSVVQSQHACTDRNTCDLTSLMQDRSHVVSTHFGNGGENGDGNGDGNQPGVGKSAEIIRCDPQPDCSKCCQADKSECEKDRCKHMLEAHGQGYTDDFREVGVTYTYNYNAGFCTSIRTMCCSADMYADAGLDVLAQLGCTACQAGQPPPTKCDVFPGGRECQKSQWVLNNVWGEDSNDAHSTMKQNSKCKEDVVLMKLQGWSKDVCALRCFQFNGVSSVTHTETFSAYTRESVPTCTHFDWNADDRKCNLCEGTPEVGGGHSRKGWKYNQGEVSTTRAGDWKVFSINVDLIMP